jgi:predicted AlkP superfamily phosphohydrolase/phosphomutase
MTNCDNYFIIIPSYYVCQDYAPGHPYGRIVIVGQQKVTKVFVLGMDGLSPTILEPMMARGELPAFSMMSEKGAYSPLATINPAQSPVVWSTIANGSNPGRHGIFDYITRKAETYLPIQSTVCPNPKNLLGRRDSSFLRANKGTPFWAITSREQIPTSVIRWPVTFPPDSVKGRMLSGLGVVDLQGSLGRYTFYVEGDIPGDTANKGEIIKVSSKGGNIRTAIAGPNKSQVPMDINVSHKDASATLTVDGRSFTVKQGEWSDWVTVNFNLVLKQIRGICRFFLQATGPPLRLYMTPVHIDPQKPAFVVSYPDEYAASLAGDIGVYATLGLPEDTNALTDGCIDDEAFLEFCDSIMVEREKMLWHEFDRFNEGLLAFVFDTTDRIQHMYWIGEDPEHPAYNAESAGKYQQVIRDYYRRMDVILGRVLEAVDDKTVLCVISDHGFGSFRRAVHVNSWLAQNGLMSLKKASKDDEGDPLFKNVAWNKTQAYAVGFSGLYLNLKGREGKGMVRPGDEAEQLKRKISDVLTSLRDPKTGKVVIQRVYKKEELFNGPHADAAPDLIVGFAPGYRASWQTAIGGTPPRILDDNMKRWSGDHIMDAESVPGIFLCNKPISGSHPTVKDIAPTVLAAFGVSRTPEMEGRPLYDPSGL